jgi:tetratricopeptide (TPR) repeat protein
LVEGTALPSRERVGVTARLVRAGDGVVVWSESYSGPAADLLTIIEDVSRKVATNVAGALLPAERSALVARPTGNTAAYDHFLKGDFYLARRTARDVARAIQEYQAAIQLDSGFVRARAKIALCYGVFLQWRDWQYPGAGPDTLLARGFATADLALQQDSSSSEAWLARGFLFTYRYKRTIQGVQAAFERAIALDPRSAEALHAYADILAELGDDSAAVATYRRALTLEPDRAITLHHLARVYVFGHRYREARRWLDSTLAVDPDYSPAYALRARVRLQLRDAVGARADAESAIRLSRAPWASATMAVVELRAGDTLAARRRVEPLVDHLLASHQATEFDAWLGIPLLALGEGERALDLLELAPRGPWLMWILRLPEFDVLRDNPRFHRIVEESRPPTAQK